jgi:hypothetical protein
MRVSLIALYNRVGERSLKKNAAANAESPRTRSTSIDVEGLVVAWNYKEFSVEYKSNQEELCVDGIYVKLLLDMEQPQTFVCDRPKRVSLSLCTVLLTF